MKNSNTPAGIEQATFRFVAQHLNHCATAAPRKLAAALIYHCHSSFHQTSVFIRRSFRALTATPLQAAFRGEFLSVPLERK